MKANHDIFSTKAAATIQAGLTMDTKKVSAIIFQELLDHFWKVHSRSEKPFLELYPEGSLITYATLCIKGNKRELTHQIGELLHSIAAYCKSESWPPLTALVVHHETRYPGSAYFSAPGCATDVQGWATDVANVVKFESYPRTAPLLPDQTSS